MVHYRVSSSVPGESRCSRRKSSFVRRKRRRCRFVLLSPRAFLSTNSLSLSPSLSRSLLCSLATRLSSYLFFFTILRRISHLSSLLRSLRRELGFSVFAIVQSHLSFLFSIPFLSLFFFFFGCNRLAYVTELAALCLLAVLSLASLSLSLSLSLFLSSFSLREPR